jgi:hypothetical protein
MLSSKDDKQGGTVVSRCAASRRVFVFLSRKKNFLVALVGLSCSTVPYTCKARKITSHQRNSKKGFCLCTLLSPRLSTTLPLSLSARQRFSAFGHIYILISYFLQPGFGRG